MDINNLLILITFIIILLKISEKKLESKGLFQNRYLAL